MKSSQSPSIRRHRANVREHSKHRYIQPSCMAAERGLCARLPPSFGHYTALNIVGKDPTDQSTSWMSTTDEPSDHEPMSASPVHVWPLATSILLILSHASPLKPGHYMCCYVGQPVRWTHFTCCDMASPLIKPCPNRLSSGGRLLASQRTSDWWGPLPPHCSILFHRHPSHSLDPHCAAQIELCVMSLVAC